MLMTGSTEISKYPLNVAKDKIQQTRYRIRGETSTSSNGQCQKTFHSSNSESQTGEELSEGDESLMLEKECIESSVYHVIDHATLKSLNNDRTEISSDINDESICHESRWFRKHLGRPLILGSREIVVKQPRDPLDYLAHFLLNYRSSQVMLKHRHQELTLRRSQLQHLESEKILSKQAKDEWSEYQMENDDESGELDDWNFRNYNMTQMA